MNSLPKISIITVCYNAGNILEKTIQSVISQTYENLEYIIIDGKSQDNTGSVLEKYQDKIDTIISEPDRGLYDAMNKGLKLATGDYVNFMNAGDFFYSNDIVSNLFKDADLSFDVIYGDSIVINPDGKEVYQTPEIDINIISQKPIYRHNASFTRLSLHKSYPFDLSKIKEFEHALDYNHIFNIWRNGARFQYIPIPVLKYERIGISDKSLKNVLLNFKISHQYQSPSVKEYFSLIKKLLRLWKRQVF